MLHPWQTFAAIRARTDVPEDPLRATDPDSPIFPDATRDDLLDELALTQLALKRLGEGFVVDRTQLRARRRRLEWWIDRIVSQLAAMDGRLNVSLVLVLVVLAAFWIAVAVFATQEIF